MMNTTNAIADILPNPFARALAKDEPVLYDTSRIDPNDRQNQLCVLCDKWLSRNKQALEELVNAQRLKEMDEELLRIIISELVDMCKTEQIKAKLPIERKGGFLAYLLNRVIVTSFTYERAKQWKNADQAATDVVTYLEKNEHMFPIDEWTFAHVDHLDEWSEDYDDRQLKRLAKQKNTDFSNSWESTEWRSSQRRQELFEMETEHYMRDCGILGSLPKDKAQTIKEYCIAYFLHMARYITPYEDYVEKIDNIFGTSYSQSAKKQTVHTQDTEPESYPFITTEPELSKKVMDKLNAYLEGKKKPRDVMMPIRAAMDAGVIRRITFSEMKTYFKQYCPSSKASVSLYTDPRSKPYKHHKTYSVMVADFKSII